jgi:hypothetical protein
MLSGHQSIKEATVRPYIADSLGEVMTYELPNFEELSAPEDKGWLNREFDWRESLEMLYVGRLSRNFRFNTE